MDLLSVLSTSAVKALGTFGPDCTRLGGGRGGGGGAPVVWSNHSTRLGGG